MCKKNKKIFLDFRHKWVNIMMCKKKKKKSFIVMEKKKKINMQDAELHTFFLKKNILMNLNKFLYYNTSNQVRKHTF